MTDRKNFSEVFEGAVPGAGIPSVTLRRFDDPEEASYGMVGVYHGGKIIAQLQFGDLFDEEGNRFHND